MPAPHLSPADTLTVQDTQIARPTDAPVTPPPPIHVVEVAPNPPPVAKPPIVPDALPPPERPGFFGWLAGLWHNIFG